MCAFILANDDSDSLGTPSPMSAVRSTQKGSIIEYIIWGFAALFIVTCILLNRMSNSESLIRSITRVVETKSAEAQPVTSKVDEVDQNSIMQMMDEIL